MRRKPNWSCDGGCIRLIEGLSNIRGITFPYYNPALRL